MPSMTGNGYPCEAGQRLELACKEGEHLRGCHRATWTVPTRPADAPFWLEVCESPSLFVGKMNPVPGIKLGERQWEEAGLGSSTGGRSPIPREHSSSSGTLFLGKEMCSRRSPMALNATPKTVCPLEVMGRGDSGMLGTGGK